MESLLYFVFLPPSVFFSCDDQPKESWEWISPPPPPLSCPLFSLFWRCHFDHRKSAPSFLFSFFSQTKIMAAENRLRLSRPPCFSNRDLLLLSMFGLNEEGCPGSLFFFFPNLLHHPHLSPPPPPFSISSWLMIFDCSSPFPFYSP